MYRAAASAVAMGICAPAMAQSFESCRGDASSWRAREIAHQCAGKTGETRQSCERRIGEVYMDKVRRCTAAENQRLDRERAREAERRERERLRGATAPKSTEGRN
ncbi:hypothetical protein [Sphingomonas colocasiae]|uniref:Uncharacterized protein n=1 Tax=Sphingomonas colocasiae TaxID=1848973 RepID=A0ABS7PSY0_9SPHN|nr:hypothetical protein [Sphingomonas colocasiae]MBY8824281.1 hypothetical protein [Sphingomonas colocasiae]